MGLSNSKKTRQGYHFYPYVAYVELEINQIRPMKLRMFFFKTKNINIKK